MVKKVFKKKISFKGEENPFNLKLNREKHTVLGQSTKGTKGLRCISRANIHLKRKELYNKTKKASQKANDFVDRRLLHENEEDSITARFVQERKKKLKKNKFNLNDEELTHRGVPLHALKSLKDEPIGSDDDDQLGATFVNNAHFGGANQERLSHKDMIEKLILESKQKKYEEKVERELTLDLTEKLDQDWKASVRANGGVPKLLEQFKFPKKKTILEQLQGTNKQKLPMSIMPKTDSLDDDPYNILEMDLKYSKKSTPIIRTKTAEELEKEEREKQLELEQERCQRMHDIREEKINAKDHLSADSIIDDFDLEPTIIEDNVNEKPSSDQDSDYSDSEDSVDINQSDPLDDVDDHDEVIEDAESDDNENDLTTDEIKESSDIPANIDEFEEYLEIHNHISAEDILAAVETIIKPFLKSKSEKKLNKLSNFFGILLEYSLKYLKNNHAVSENLAPYLFDIAEIAPLKTTEKILSLLDEEQELFLKHKAKKKKSNFPRVQSLITLKYCSVLYSVSDFSHPVVTPAILFMCDILSNEFFINFQNIESRLYICSVVLDCVTQSKRLVPEALYFLNKILNLACPHKNESMSKNQIINLVISEKLTSSTLIDLNVFCPDESVIEDLRKVSIILKSVNLLNKFTALYAHLPSFHNLFSETLSTCIELPTEYYPSVLIDAVSMFIQEIKKQDRKLYALTYENTKPKPLKLFEPSYDSKFTKKDDIKMKFKLLKSVSQKIKKEEKDMLREMRRDFEVVAAEKLKEQLASDAERKRKVKELYHDLSVQEGEYKKLMKTKP